MIKAQPKVNAAQYRTARAEQDQLRKRVELARPPNKRITNEHVFQLKLESHLHDVKLKRPWRTPTVHTELKRRHVDNREILADIDPQAMRMYMGLIVGMGYRQQARLASSVFHMSRHLEQLSRVDEELAAIRTRYA